QSLRTFLLEQWRQLIARLLERPVVRVNEDDRLQSTVPELLGRVEELLEPVAAPVVRLPPSVIAVAVHQWPHDDVSVPARLQLRDDSVLVSLGVFGDEIGRDDVVGLSGARAERQATGHTG